jgi:hypothetical protein
MLPSFSSSLLSSNPQSGSKPPRSYQFGIRRNSIIANDLTAVAGLATRLKDYGGEQEAVKLFERAMRLSPKHPWWVPHAYGVALHLVGRK